MTDDAGDRTLWGVPVLSDCRMPVDTFYVSAFPIELYGRHECDADYPCDGRQRENKAAAAAITASIVDEREQWWAGREVRLGESVAMTVRRPESLIVNVEESP